MRIWLVKVGEPWPTDGNAPRLHRTGVNSSFLAKQGHNVVWWSGTFDHMSKTERTGRDVDMVTADGYRLIGIHAGKYERNVSIERIHYHRLLAKRFRAMASKMTVPELIVVSLTPLELACAAVDIGRAMKIPVVVDVRDLWPDIWAEHLPPVVKPLKRLVLAPFYKDLKHAIRDATAVIGVTDAMVDWAISSTGRRKSSLDRAFPFAYLIDPPAEEDLALARQYWRENGVGANPNEIVGCFFGNISDRPDFETPLGAVAAMPDDLRSRVRLVLCGRGANEQLLRNYASLTAQISFHGYAHAPQIKALMDISQFGLLPYPPDFDFVKSLPNKVFEYLAGGLPVVTSLIGEVENLFAKYSCGVLYKSGDPRSFAALMRSFVCEPDRLSDLAAGARVARQAYDPLQICKGFEEYLETIVAQSNRSNVALTGSFIGRGGFSA